MIGVFDSGLGGLTILRALRRQLPTYDYLYLGDTLHVPYGNRSDAAIYDLSRRACEHLFESGCSLIIVACNTASAKALRRLQQEYLPLRRESDSRPINILGVIRPLAEHVAKISHGRVGVIGTRATVNSQSYVVELNKLADTLIVRQNAAPLLVPLIEENFIKRRETVSILRRYLRPLKDASVDTLILGCTHYPMLLKQVRAVMGKKCFVPDPGEIVATALVAYLQRHPEMESVLTKTATVTYRVTDLNENFSRVAATFLGECPRIEKVILP